MCQGNLTDCHVLSLPQLQLEVMELVLLPVHNELIEVHITNQPVRHFRVLKIQLFINTRETKVPVQRARWLVDYKAPRLMSNHVEWWSSWHDRRNHSQYSTWEMKLAKSMFSGRLTFPNISHSPSWIYPVWEDVPRLKDYPLRSSSCDSWSWNRNNVE